MEKKIPKIHLNNGQEIPVIGLGTWKTERSKIGQVVKDAISLGYRHIDCAMGHENEKEIGNALQELFNSKTISRQDLFITGKLWNTFHKEGFVKTGVQQTLTDLKLKYLDLYLMHWPMGFQEGGGLNPTDDVGNILYSDVDYVETYKEMEKLVEQGLVKSIGVANFNSHQLGRLTTSCATIPVINQIECHPYLNQEKLIKFCKECDIAVAAYSPLGSPDRPWRKPDEPVLLEDPKILHVAREYGKSSAQILVRYAIQRNLVVIPKAADKLHIFENIDVVDFELSDDDMTYLNSLDQKLRFWRVDNLADHEYYPFHSKF